MKFFSCLSLILIVFFKTGNLLSDINLFNVNNILIEKVDNSSNEKLANQAIEKAFNKLSSRILLKKDFPKVSSLQFSEIRELVTYYNIIKNSEEENNKINFSITFDKDKIHNLLLKKKILYSDITDKEFFILPILLKENEIFIFSNNYFYENWNKNKNDELIEFILPLENIELIQSINGSRNNLLDLELNSLFKEYSNKNIAIALIEENNSEEEDIYIKAKIQNKIISKGLKFKKNNYENIELNQKKILEIKNEIINLVKSQNLIDINVPSFLNVRLIKKRNSTLEKLNSKMINLNLIENIMVQEFNNDYVKLKIKYLGRLEKIVDQLKKENIILELINDQWIIRLL